VDGAAHRWLLGTEPLLAGARAPQLDPGQAVAGGDVVAPGGLRVVVGGGGKPGQQAAHRRDDSLGWSGHKNRTGWDWAGDWLRVQVLPCEVQVFVAPLRLQLLPSAHSLG